MPSAHTRNPDAIRPTQPKRGPVLAFRRPVRREKKPCGEGERRGDMRTPDRGQISCEHELLVCGRRSSKRAWAIGCMMSAHSPRSFFWTDGDEHEAGQDQDEQRRLGL
eukprot:6376633-Prymnesium_polylepis.1